MTNRVSAVCVPQSQPTVKMEEPVVEMEDFVVEIEGPAVETEEPALISPIDLDRPILSGELRSGAFWKVEPSSTADTASEQSQSYTSNSSSSSASPQVDTPTTSHSVLVFVKDESSNEDDDIAVDSGSVPDVPPASQPSDSRQSSAEPSPLVQPPFQHGSLEHLAWMNRGLLPEQIRRVDWSRVGGVLDRATYCRPEVEGKWWSISEESYAKLPRRKAGEYGHVGFIMEGGYGERVPDDRKCSRCEAEGYECWKYRPLARLLVARHTDTCARCSLKDRTKGPGSQCKYPEI